MRGEAVIAVTPPSEAAARSRLLAGLEEAFPVRFERREPSGLEAGADAVLAFGPLAEPGPRIPSLVFAGSPLSGSPSRVTFAASSHVDHRLRGRTLGEVSKDPRRLAEGGDGEVLAARGSAPVWARASDGPGRTGYLAASPPEELGHDKPLKARFRAGQFEALLPLVHFLREVSAPYAWDSPPLRAMVMFDDPNLRWPSYGHIDYRDLLEHAREHRYHAAMAMIPIDAAVVHPRAARLYREHSDRLSLLMHGLRHLHRELMQPLSQSARERRVARGLRSIEAFERRSGVSVSRVMAAPHGEASEQYLATLLRLGVEALFADLPFPWRAGEEPRGPALTYWHPVNFVAGGMPVIPRYPFTYDLDEIILRAYLDHPLVLYGHHEDVADGLEPLRQVTALVNGLGSVRWESAAGIARQNFMTRRAGKTFAVRLLARRLEVVPPPEADTVEVDLSLVDRDLDQLELAVSARDGRTTAVPAARSVALEAAGERLTIELRSRRRLDHRGVPAARLTPWPIVRRALAESRDRLRPLVR